MHSFDYDEQSVECTKQLKIRYFKDDSDWIVEQRSAIDLDYIQSPGGFDIVYSWRVLHHTGDMQKALEYAEMPINAQGGAAIYSNLQRSRAAEQLLETL